MSRRLPAGNRVVGRDERDDPGRVPCGGALVGGRGRVHLRTLDGPSHGLVVEPAARRPLPVHLGEHRPHHPDGRLPAREHLHHAAAVPGLAVGALLHVVGAKPRVVPAGEVGVGRRVCLGVLEELGRLGAEAVDLLDGQVVQLAHEPGVALGEHCLQDAEHGAPLPPGRRVSRGVAHQVHDAPLPRRARENLLDRALEALVGVAGDADGARHAARPQRQEERFPAVVRLGVDRVEAEQAPVAVRAGAAAVAGAVDCTRPASLHLM